jgi:hypothetical protein
MSKSSASDIGLYFGMCPKLNNLKQVTNFMDAQQAKEHGGVPVQMGTLHMAG